MEAYQDNLETHDLDEDLTGAVELLVQHAEYVTKELWIRLQGIGRRFETNQALPGEVYGADFSMAGELEAQISAVRAMRNRIMRMDGTLSKEISTREAKEVVGSMTSMMNTLMKHHEKVVNMERLRILESSVVDVLMEVDPEIKEMVLVKMEEKLANIG